MVLKEVVQEIMEDQFNSSHSPYSVLKGIVATLCRDLSWLRAPTLKQNFHWGIVASCCEKIPITTKNLKWVHLCDSITSLGSIYNCYCKEKKLPEEKCLLSAEKLPQDIVHSENIKKYMFAVTRISPLDVYKSVQMDDRIIGTVNREIFIL